MYKSLVIGALTSLTAAVGINIARVLHPAVFPGAAATFLSVIAVATVAAYLVVRSVSHE